MNTSRTHKAYLYAGTLVIELITGLFRLLLTIPLTIVLFLIVTWVLSQLGFEVVDVVRLNFDLPYARQWLGGILIVAAILAYANIITSLIAYFGYGGGSLLTRFVLGARKASTREREAIMGVFEQMADGADFPIRSYSKLYVVDSVQEYANLVGTTLYISSAGLRGNNLQAFVAHEFGHLNNGDGSLILALRRLVFPPFSLFIGGIRDFSTNRPKYRPDVKEFDTLQVFYSIVNNIIFFTLAFIGGGLGVWVLSWAWASYFRQRDYAADSFAARLGYRDLLVQYLDGNIFFDTAVPYMLGWQPAAELRIDALQHPDAYGLPVYGDIPAAEAAAPFAPLTEVEPVAEQAGASTAADGRGPAASSTARNLVSVALVVVVGYLLLRSWPQIRDGVGEMVAEAQAALALPTATAVAGQVDPAETRESAATGVATATPTEAAYDCLAAVSVSRGVGQHGRGDTCWLKLADGAAATLDFHDEVQVTYRTASGGNDVYFYLASPGDRLTNVVGATIRPMPFVYATYGGPEEVKAFEVQYHSPGGEWVTCLRDANHNDVALNDACGDAATTACPDTAAEAAARFGGSVAQWRRLQASAWKYGPAPAAPIQNLVIPEAMKGDWWDDFQSYSEVGPAEVGYASEATIWCVPAKAAAVPVKSRVEALVAYHTVFSQEGWCALWETLMEEGLTEGDCPITVLQYVFEDVATADGSVNLVTGAQISARDDTQIFYPACATFDDNATVTGGTVEPWLDDDFIGTNTTLGAGSVFTLYYRCDNAWSPPVSDEAKLDAALDAAVLVQISRLGFDTAEAFVKAWGLRIGSDRASGEVDPGEITTCPGESNGCVRIVRETNARGDVEWPFYARNPTGCRYDGYRREPGAAAQTGVPANFDGWLEGITIRRCQETRAANSGQMCKGTELGPLAQADHTLEAPVIVLQLWRMNGDSPWGDGEVTTVVEDAVTIRASGGNAWSYPAADCLEVATLHMRDGSNLRGSTVVTPEELRAAGMID